MTPRKILCPVDFSEHSELALRYAGAWARRTGGEAWVLTVERFDVPPYLTPELLGDLRHQLRSQRRSAARHLAEFATRFLGKGVRARFEIAEGSPAEMILSRLGPRKAQALVMGTHGRSGTMALMMGSSTERVAIATPVPLLVVRAGRALSRPPLERGRLAFGRVVLPDDQSPETDRLLESADCLLRRSGSRVFPVRLESWREQGAADKVLAEAEKTGADLVVVHLAPRKVYRGWVPDENTTQVMRYSPCPVLVLPSSSRR